MTQMVGANPAELEALAARMERSASQIDSMSTDVLRLTSDSPWRGPAADQFRQQWARVGSRQMGASAGMLRQAAENLRRNASAQRETSAAETGAFLPGGIGGNVGRGHTPERSVPCYESGRSAVAGALAGVNQTGKDEIQIRKLDNGKYIIVLPGVVDLSSGIATRNPGSAVKEWMDPNDANSVRDMRYAIPSGASPDYANPYATRVKEAMLAAGVPPGSDVMLVGHSYGAYTAAYLASDHDFNDAFGSPSGYHVNVTHMVAAGAETDVYFDRMPEGTHALVLNNRRDLAYEAEDNAHGNVDPVYGGQKEFVFNGGGKGWGHDPQNYTDWLQNSTDREDLGAWLDSAGDYAESGSAVNYTVPDVE